jgi:enterochelin esterase-like enzyme
MIQSGAAAGFLLLTAPVFSQSPPVSPDDQYVLPPDSEVQAGVPEGLVIELKLPASKVFPGFDHEAWLYLPASYDGRQRLALMVFQDGVSGYLPRDGSFRVAVVLNNLISRGDIPAMAAVFINPGLSRKYGPDGAPLNTAYNRSFEYDTPDGAYAQFLVDEVLPEVRKHASITDDPEGRGIAGYSSGGICAFNAAWHRPDQFRKVFTNNGSFVDIRGGHIIPERVRASAKKPLRVFQQDGANDRLDGPVFSKLDWPAGNQALASALQAKGYDHKFVFGEGTHSPKHAGSVFPDAMRWLWRDYRP